MSFGTIHMLFYHRSSLHQNGQQRGGDFVIMAFVNDVEQDVVEGLDGVQHV